MLEETGLPAAKIRIILTIFLIVVAFVVWSLLLELDEVTHAQGYITERESGGFPYHFVVRIPLTERPRIEVGSPALVKVPQVSPDARLRGLIGDIRQEGEVDETGKVYYEALVAPHLEPGTKWYFEENLVSNMEIQVEITTGSRTLFEYMLRPIVKARESAFREK